MTAEEQDNLRQELVKSFLELKLFKETKLTVLNELKINGHLIPRLRGYKYGELQRDVETMYCLYGNMIDYKDDLIDILNTQLEDAAAQDARALSHHYDILCDLVGCFNYKAEKACKQFKNQREALHKKFEKELGEIQSKHAQEMKEIEESENAKTAEFDDKMKWLLEKYERMSNEINEKMVDEKQNIKAKMEPQKEKLMNLITEAHDNYLKITSDRRRLYEELKAKDDKRAGEIKRTLQTILLVTDNIKKLEKKINDASDKSALKIALLRQAEEMLRIRESYVKLELEEEKLYPFYKSHLTQDCELAQQTEAFKLSKFPDLEDTKEYYKLEKYFKLYNKVQLDNFILERELEDLNVKNQQLRNALKKYFDDIQVDRSILQDDTRLVIAGSLQAVPNPFYEEYQQNN